MGDTNMSVKIRTGIIAAMLLAIAFAPVAMPVSSQDYGGTAQGTGAVAGAQYGATGQGQTYSASGVYAGPGGVQTFNLGSGYTFAVMPVRLTQQDIQKYQDQGVQMLRVPAGTSVYVTTTTQGGQPGTGITVGTGQQEAYAGAQAGPLNVMVFGPQGLYAFDRFTGTSVSAGPGGVTQSFSFTGESGQAYLVLQRSAVEQNGVLVMFE